MSTRNYALLLCASLASATMYSMELEELGALTASEEELKKSCEDDNCTPAEIAAWITMKRQRVQRVTALQQANKEDAEKTIAALNKLVGQ